MTILQEINEEANPDLLEASLLENIQKLEEIVDTKVMDLTQLQKGFEAAARGLGLANKLKNPADKKKHLSRVMTNMNMLRSALNKAYDAIEAESK